MCCPRGSIRLRVPWDRQRDELARRLPNEQNRIAFEWTDRSRIDRINELLRAKTSMTLADSMAIQTDAVSTQSRRADSPARILEFAGRRSGASARAAQGVGPRREHLEHGCGDLRSLGDQAPRQGDRGQSHARAARKLVGEAHLEAVIDYLEHPGALLGPDPMAARNTILLESLKAALAN